MVSSAASILSMLADLYGKTWEVVHGKSDSEALIKFLNGLNHEDARRVFSHCLEQVGDGNKWAPSLIEMMNYCDSPTESEYFMILSRIQSGEPENKIEKYLCENIKYNLHLISQGEEIQFLKTQYRLAREMEKSGKLRTNEDGLRALPKHSAVNLNDIHRERFSGSLHPRVKKLLSGN